MAVTTPDKNKDKIQFQSSASAIRALKVGKRNPNWIDAAEFLINRASPEVKLLLEAAQEIERQKWQTTTTEQVSSKVVSSLFTPAQWAIMISVGALFTGLMIWIASQFGLQNC